MDRIIRSILPGQKATDSRSHIKGSKRRKRNGSAGKVQPASLSQGEQLTARISNGGPGAFADLYEMYRGNVHRFILTRVNNRCEVEDLVQETFTQAYRSIGEAFKDARRF